MSCWNFVSPCTCLCLYELIFLRECSSGKHVPICNVIAIASHVNSEGAYIQHRYCYAILTAAFECCALMTSEAASPIEIKCCVKTCDFCMWSCREIEQEASRSLVLCQHVDPPRASSGTGPRMKVGDFEGAWGPWKTIFNSQSQLWTFERLACLG